MRLTPALVIAAQAFAIEPWASIPRVASSMTETSRPAVRASIADQATLLSTTTVSGLTGAITDVNVTLTIHHTRDSNLAVTLISPDGTYVQLINHNGGTGANFINTKLDD